MDFYKKKAEEKLIRLSFAIIVVIVAQWNLFNLKERKVLEKLHHLSRSVQETNNSSAVPLNVKAASTLLNHHSLPYLLSLSPLRSASAIISLPARTYILSTEPVEPIPP